MRGFLLEFPSTNEEGGNFNLLPILELIESVGGIASRGLLYYCISRAIEKVNNIFTSIDRDFVNKCLCSCVVLNPKFLRTNFGKKTYTGIILDLFKRRFDADFLNQGPHILMT